MPVPLVTQTTQTNRASLHMLLLLRATGPDEVSLLINDLLPSEPPSAAGGGVGAGVCLNTCSDAIRGSRDFSGPQTDMVFIVPLRSCQMDAVFSSAPPK